MCNSVHKVHKKIPETGRGFKIFRLDDRKNIISLFGGFCYGTKGPLCVNKEARAHGNTFAVYEGDPSVNIDCTFENGFCFFFSLEEAKRCLSDIESRKEMFILEIEYTGGMCSQLEDGITVYGPYEIGIAKCFRPVVGWEWGKQNV